MPEATVSKQPVNPTDVLITACGGIYAAGRCSGHQAYNRMVFDALTPELQQQTLDELATLTGQAQEHILATL